MWNAQKPIYAIYSSGITYITGWFNENQSMSIMFSGNTTGTYVNDETHIFDYVLFMDTSTE